MVAGGVLQDKKAIVFKFHPLVRWAHWLSIPTILALTTSGLSIYWASPVISVSIDGEATDVFSIVGAFALKLSHDSSESSRNWFYDHFALGSGNLAYALNIHWLFAYLFMLIALLYAAGSLISGSYRSLLPRPSDLSEIPAMIRFYLNVLPSFITRKPNPHPVTKGKYNGLQRFAYFSVSIASFFSLASGWAIHKPAQLGWLQWLLGGYDFARDIHLVTMLFFCSFVVPHVVLVAVSGWDCFRSMIVGWSTDVKN